MHSEQVRLQAGVLEMAGQGNNMLGRRWLILQEACLAMANFERRGRCCAPTWSCS